MQMKIFTIQMKTNKNTNGKYAIQMKNYVTQMKNIEFKWKMS